MAPEDYAVLGRKTSGSARPNQCELLKLAFMYTRHDVVMRDYGHNDSTIFAS